MAVGGVMIPLSFCFVLVFFVLFFVCLFLVFQNKNVILCLNINVCIKTLTFGLRSAWFFTPSIRFSYPIRGSRVWCRFFWFFVCLFQFLLFWHPKRDTRVSNPTSKNDPFHILVFVYEHKSKWPPGNQYIIDNFFSLHLTQVQGKGDLFS